MADNITDIRYVRTAQRAQLERVEAEVSAVLAELAEIRATVQQLTRRIEAIELKLVPSDDA
ncbi:MAG: hypothetical protein JO266_18590 [Acidobacteria bacterium]|nr:hypothetical protein [Acidobacteriota bacterium]MBV9480061.1 hypothetical protein [Acidobacteriota bacterium]